MLWLQSGKKCDTSRRHHDQLDPGVVSSVVVLGVVVVVGVVDVVVLVGDVLQSEK